MFILLVRFAVKLNRNERKDFLSSRRVYLPEYFHLFAISTTARAQGLRKDLKDIYHHYPPGALSGKN